MSEPTSPTNSDKHATAEPAVLRDRFGHLWSAADLARSAEIGVAYLTRQVLPAFDRSDPRRGA